MPQPIDPNTELMRITTAERIQQIMDRTSLAGQAHQTAQAAQDQVAMETHVQQTQQKDAHIDDEMRRRNPYRGKKKKPGNRSQLSAAARVFYTAAEHKETVEDPEEHDLDVEV